MSDRMFQIKEEDLQLVLNTLGEFPFKHVHRAVTSLQSARLVQPEPEKTEEPAEPDK